MTTTTPTTKTLAHVLATFASHCATLRSRHDCGGLKGMGLWADDGTHVYVELEFKTRGPGVDEGWDSVYVDGRWEGNRFGGVARYAELCAPVIAAQARVDAERSTLAAQRSVTAQRLSA